MSKISCDIDYSSDYNDNGNYVDCVIATCSKCGHETNSWGHGDTSVKRCLVLMNEECPKHENNFYVES